MFFSLSCTVIELTAAIDYDLPSKRLELDSFGYGQPAPSSSFADHSIKDFAARHQKIIASVADPRCFAQRSRRSVTVGTQPTDRACMVTMVVRVVKV